MGKGKFGSIVAEILAENERRRKEVPLDFYSVIHPSNLFTVTQRTRSLLRLLRREGIASLAGLRILEVGCGAADWLLNFVSWGATPEHLCGIDIDGQQIAQAVRKLPSADLRPGNAANLPWFDDHFDIVLQATAFTSILDSEFKKAIATEMIRVTKPGGLILWYDFRFDNPWNPHVRGIGARELKQLFPGCSLRLKRVTLLPPLARWIVPLSWAVALLFEKIPPLRTHILACIRSPGPTAREHALRRPQPPSFTGAQERPWEGIYYSPMSASQAREVANLHSLCFRDFFLTGLGEHILSLYYSHYHGRADSICFVARTRRGKIIGFVAGSRNYRNFIRSFYRAQFLQLALGIIRAFFLSSDLRSKIRQRTPQIKDAIASLFRIRHSHESLETTQSRLSREQAGLASVAVHQHLRGRGVAVQLFQMFEQRAKELGVREVELSVLASNARAIGFYKKLGWLAVGRDERDLIFRKRL